MKINRLETHDRLLHFKKQSDYISKGCEDCIKNRPEEFGSHPFYIYAHARTDDDGVSKRLLWTPRLTKPKAETNSMLFKYYPKTDTIKIIWIIPAKELWKQYKKGNVTESNIVQESIVNFLNDKSMLEAKEDDDLSDDQVDAIYTQISLNNQNKKLMDRLFMSQIHENMINERNNDSKNS